MAHEAKLPAYGLIPAVSAAKKLPKHTEALVIPVFEGEEELILPGSGLFKDKIELEVLQTLTAVGATGAAEQVTKIPAPAGSGVDIIVAVGLGNADEVTETKVRRAAGVAARSLTGIAKAATTLHTFGTRAAVEGAVLGGYQYRGLQTADAPERTTPVRELVFVGADRAEVEAALIVAEAVVFARDLVNTPSSHLYPESYAAVAAESAKKAGLKVEVIDATALRKAGYGGILAVGGGSERQPRLVRITYRAKKASKTVALVGKGVTFDTGGISIKPPTNMHHMISDMGGSAAVLAAIIAAARLKLQVNISATIPMAENMPGSRAYRPGDVITHYGGKTTEVINTDAEGRLILADAIARACEDDLDYLIEAATLTGAQLVALGTRTTGVMGSQALRDRIAKLGRDVDEPAWAMPIPEEVAASMKSPVADLSNLAPHRNAGMLSAGYFLGEFVANGIEWAHLDIAGPAFNTESAHGFTPKRGTGAPVRTLIAALRDIAGEG